MQADQYEKEQWKIISSEQDIAKLESRADDPACVSSSEYNVGDITVDELRTAVRLMKSKKSGKPSSIPNDI